MSIYDTCVMHSGSISLILSMTKTLFYTVRQPGLSRLSLQDGPNWSALCYQDIRTYTLTSPDLLVLLHSQFLITLRGPNLRQLYLSLLVEEVYEVPIHTGPIPPQECAVTQIFFELLPEDD
jgi:hypothetical protein